MTSHAALWGQFLNVETRRPQMWESTVSFLNNCAAEAGGCWKRNDGEENVHVQVWLFAEQRLLLQWRGVCGWRDGAESGEIVTWLASLKQNWSKASGLQGLLLTIMVVFVVVVVVGGSCLRTVMMNVDLEWRKSGPEFTYGYCISKDQSGIWFKTTYESGPNLIWRDKIPWDLYCH